MKILVVSDTHGSISAWRSIERFFDGVGAIYHLGDVLYHGPRNPLPHGYDPKELSLALRGLEVTYVRGNCDADVDLMVLSLSEVPKVRVVDVMGWNVVLTHGDIVKDIDDFLEKTGADILLLGHTHVHTVTEKNGALVVNPGSPSLPKGDGVPSIAILEIERDFVKASVHSLEGDILVEGRKER